MADTTFNIRHAWVERGVTACLDRYRSKRRRSSLGISISDENTWNGQADVEFDRLLVPSRSVLCTQQPNLLFGVAALCGEPEDGAGRNGRHYRIDVKPKQEVQVGPCV